MNYIPGDINDYLQKEHYFLINQDFSWIHSGGFTPSFHIPVFE